MVVWKFALKREGLVSRSTANSLLEFCCANALVLINTFFDHKRIHLATWTALGGRNEDQIDSYQLRYLMLG
jgi:hypothetical protein